MKVIYVAGCYRSNCEWQLEQFLRQAEDASLRLWREGWAVFCPHKNTAHFGGAFGIPNSTWLEGDLEILKRCDAIYMLNNWQQSEGAKIELALAKKMGKEILYEVRK